MAGKGVLSIAQVPAEPGFYYVGLQPTDFQEASINFVSPNFTYNPATGTLAVGGVQYQTAGSTTTGLPRSSTNYIDQAYSQSIAQSILTDVAPFSITITPTSVNSKIAIFVNWFGEHQTTAGWDAMYGLKRNGGAIGFPLNVSNRTGGMAMAANSYYTPTANDDSTPEALSFYYLDSPRTTQPVTYQLTVQTGTAALTLYTNRTVGDINQASDYERGTSSIVAIETA
jgi:hypothetical protein